jgi:hypothetical protein
MPEIEKDFTINYTHSAKNTRTFEHIAQKKSQVKSANRHQKLLAEIGKSAFSINDYILRDRDEDIK